MDIHATDSNSITGEEKQGPKTPNAENMKDQAAPPSEQEWKAGRREWMIIIVLAIVSLMVALDATILVPVLPVSAFDP